MLSFPDFQKHSERWNSMLHFTAFRIWPEPYSEYTSLKIIIIIDPHGHRNLRPPTFSINKHWSAAHYFGCLIMRPNTNYHFYKNKYSQLCLYRWSSRITEWSHKTNIWILQFSKWLPDWILQPKVLRLFPAQYSLTSAESWPKTSLIHLQIKVSENVIE